jgi:hypothetical protein
VAALWEDGSVDQLIDLDAVAIEIDKRRAGWVADGIQVGSLTWRDALAPWPQPIVTDRALALEPESLGVVLTVNQETLGQVCLWRGGWADVEFMVNGEIVS